MKKIVLTLLAVATFGTMMAQENINAERRAPRMMTPEQMTERMTKELDLNQDQQAKLQDLNKAYEDVIARPGMGRGPRGPRPDGMRPEGMQRPENMQKADNKKADEKVEKKADAQTGATQRPQRPERAGRPEMTEAQKAEMEKRMERRKEYDEKLKEILTPEQFEKYQLRRQPRGPRR